MAQYQAVPPPPAAQDPGRTLGIIGLILSIIGCTSPIGVILSIVAFVQSRGVGIRNNIALAGIIVGAVWIVLSIILQVTIGLAGFVSRPG
jgi:hypothetical protein